MFFSTKIKFYGKVVLFKSLNVSERFGVQNSRIFHDVESTCAIGSVNISCLMLMQKFKRNPTFSCLSLRRIFGSLRRCLSVFLCYLNKNKHKLSKTLRTLKGISHS